MVRCARAARESLSKYLGAGTRAPLVQASDPSGPRDADERRNAGIVIGWLVPHTDCAPRYMSLFLRAFRSVISRQLRTMATNTIPVLAESELLDGQM